MPNQWLLAVLNHALRHEGPSRGLWGCGYHVPRPWQDNNVGAPQTPNLLFALPKLEQLLIPMLNTEDAASPESSRVEADTA